MRESNYGGFSFEKIKELEASDRQSCPKIAAYMDQKFVTRNTNGTHTLTRQILLSKVLDDVHNLPIVQKRITNYLDDGESHIAALDRNVLAFWTDGKAQGHKNLYYTRTNYGNGDIVDISQSFNDSSNVGSAFNDSNSNLHVYDKKAFPEIKKSS